MRRFFALGTLAILSSISTGCVAEQPPPRAPDNVPPRIADAPSSPPAPGRGRLVLDVEGQPARVSLVTDSVVGLDRNDGSLLASRRQQRLCLTPCILDLPQGKYMLHFSRRHGAAPSSSVEVEVMSKTTVVRQSLGREHHGATAYAAGAMLAVLGGGVTLMGIVTSSIGVAMTDSSSSSYGENGANRNGFMSFGLTALGIGLASAAVGLLLITNNRPPQQPAATTTWTR